jgi:hypothetical protein
VARARVFKLPVPFNLTRARPGPGSQDNAPQWTRATASELEANWQAPQAKRGMCTSRSAIHEASHLRLPSEMPTRRGRSASEQPLFGVHPGHRGSCGISEGRVLGEPELPEPESRTSRPGRWPRGLVASRRGCAAPPGDAASVRTCGRSARPKPGPKGGVEVDNEPRRLGGACQRATGAYMLPLSDHLWSSPRGPSCPSQSTRSRALSSAETCGSVRSCREVTTEPVPCRSSLRCRAPLADFGRGVFSTTAT